MATSEIVSDALRIAGTWAIISGYRLEVSPS